MNKEKTETIDIQRILELMPHRYPLLLVDRVIEYVASERIKTLKNVTINEPFFMGHFPEMPIMPGVLIVEAMAQSAGLLYLLTKKTKKSDYVFYFMGIDKVRFRKPVVPGDQLIIDVDVIHAREKALKIAATATVDGQLAAQAELMAAVGERK